MTKHVFIRGNFEEGNFGDDCLLAANILLLRQWGHIPLMLGRSSVSAEPDLRVATGTITQMVGGGVILYGGGTQFFYDPTIPPGDEPPELVARIVKLGVYPTRLAASVGIRLRAALLRRLPTAAVGLGVGPFGPGAESDERAVTETLRNMTFLWVRDSESADFCHSRHIDYFEGSDLCFSSPFLKRFVSGQVNTNHADRTLGIVLSDHPTIDGLLLSNIVSAARSLRADGVKVRFISFSAKKDGFISKLQALGEVVSVWDPGTMSITSFRSFIAEHNAIVTSRFHGGVFSVINQTPFAIIGVNAKLKQLARRYSDARIPLLATTDSACRFAETAQMLLDESEVRRPLLGRVLELEMATASLGERAFSTFLGANGFGQVAQ